MEKTTITVCSQHNRNISEMRGKLIQQLRKDLIDKVYTRGDGDKERIDHIIRKITLYSDSFLLITRGETSGQLQTVHSQSNHTMIILLNNAEKKP